MNQQTKQILNNGQTLSSITSPSSIRVHLVLMIHNENSQQ